MKKLLLLIIFSLLLFGCSNRLEEYNCEWNTNDNSKGSTYLVIKAKEVDTKLSNFNKTISRKIEYEDKDKIIFTSSPTPKTSKYYIDYTFYKKTKKLRENWINDNNIYLHQCEKLN